MDYSQINYPKPDADYGDLYQGGYIDANTPGIHDLPIPLYIITCNHCEPGRGDQWVDGGRIVGNLPVCITDDANGVLSDRELMRVAEIGFNKLTHTNLYTHCALGLSRSSYINAAILMYMLDISRDEALDIIKQSRPNINPIQPFRDHLERMEPSLRARKMVDGKDPE